MDSGRQKLSVLGFVCWKPCFLQCGEDQYTRKDEINGERETEIRREHGEKKEKAKGGWLSFPTRWGLVFRGEVRLGTQQELLNT